MRIVRTKSEDENREEKNGKKGEDDTGEDKKEE